MIRVKKVHRLSAYILAGFLALHIGNHLAAASGPQTHIHLMSLLRKVYRNPLIEPALISAFGIQVISGLLLIFKRRWPLTSHVFRIQAMTGLYLTFFLIYHLRAVILGRFMWKVDTNFYFAANVAAYGPSRAFFIPYYWLSVLCLFAHIACAHYNRRILLSVYPGIITRKRATREAFIIFAIGATASVTIMAAISGLLYDF